MENADKRSVQRRLDAGGVFGLISFGEILPVAALMTSPANPASMAVADLGIDPTSYLDLPQPELAAAMATMGMRPIRSVKLNAQPLLLPWERGPPLFKISATASENALARIEDLNLERYACMYEAEAGLACDPGYDNWRLLLIHPSRKPLSGAPVQARPRVIRVVLPAGLSLISFEKELHQRLSPAGLRRWIASPAGRKHCCHLGIDPREAMRLTGYNSGESERVSRADELYIFKPRLDGGRLLTIVERIVHDYVRLAGADARPSWGWVSINQGYRGHR